MKIIEQNKKAYFDYFILESIEAGICLKGSEVKSIKQGNISLKDTFCHFSNGELFLKNCHISPFEKGSYFNLDGKRDRKLLLHKAQINRLIGKVKEKGLTLVALKVYFLSNRVKVEIGLAKGKHLYDKRNVLKERDILREAKRQIKNYN